jgi:hypothetical protein
MVVIMATALVIVQTTVLENTSLTKSSVNRICQRVNNSCEHGQVLGWLNAIIIKI